MSEETSRESQESAGAEGSSDVEVASPTPGSVKPQVMSAAVAGGRLLFRLAALVVVVAGLRAAEPILIPMLLAVFLVVLSHPLLDALLRRGMRPSLAMAATVAAAIAVLTVFALIINGAVSGFLAAAPTYQELLITKAQGWLEAARQNATLSRWLSPERFDFSPVVDLAGGIVGGTVRGVASFVSLLFMTLVAMVFMLAETLGLPDKMRRAFGEGAETLLHVQNITRSTQRYVAVKTFVSALVGLTVGILTAVLGIEFPVVWAVVAFFMHYIPNFGAFAAALPTILVALAQYGLGRAFLVALGYLVIGSVFGNILEPALLGRRVGLSPLAVLLSLVFWGWVWGPIGMILSVPVTVILKITFEHTERLEWLAILLGPSAKRADPGF
jgi:predicted PurR-regulated permease PerM